MINIINNIIYNINNNKKINNKNLYKHEISETSNINFCSWLFWIYMKDKKKDRKSLQRLWQAYSCICNLF